MDATVQALAKHLEEAWDALLKHIGGADDELFHWTPGPAFNSVAILLRHLAGSERYWIGEAIGGIPSRRVRDQEFVHDRPRREDVLRAVADARRQTQQVLAALTLADLQAEASSGVTRGDPPGRPTKMWALLHYIDHLAYHCGQALLLLKLARSAPRETAAR